MKRFLVAVSAALFVSGTAFAQSSVVVTSDSTETSGSTVVIPGDVTTYVTEQQVPSVTYEGDVTVGSELPSSVEVYSVPSNNDYAYTVVNKKRVIVNPHTHKVVQIVK